MAPDGCLCDADRDASHGPTAAASALSWPPLLGGWRRMVPWALNIDRALLAVPGRLELKCQRLTDLGTSTIALKGGNMNEDRLTAVQRRDEAESAIVVPLLQLAVESHGPFRLDGEAKPLLCTAQEISHRFAARSSERLGYSKKAEDDA